MKVFKTNPIIKDQSYRYDGEDQASYSSIFLKTSLFIVITLIGSYLGSIAAMSSLNVLTYLIYLLVVPVSAYVALRFAMKMDILASILGIISSLTQGMFLGFIIRLSISSGNPMLLMTIFTTLVVLVVMLLVYLIKPLREQPSIYKAIIGMFLGVSIGLIGSLLLDELNMEYQFDSVILTIALISFFAAIFYSADFDQIITLVHTEAPKSKEWIMVLGLLNTIIWIFPRVIHLVLLIYLKSVKKA